MPAKWGGITVGEILPPIKGDLILGPSDLVISGISTDSRTIGQRQLFLALKGERYDGHDFIDRAIEKGAAAIIAQGYLPSQIRPGRDVAFIRVEDTLKAMGDLACWWRHEHSVLVAAITGSVGKTTTKDMAAGILRINSPTLKNEGNLNNLIGLPLTLLSLEEYHRRTVLEMGMNRPGEIGRLTEIADPDVGLITRIGIAHLEGVGDMRGVAKAKTELLEKISPASHVVLNGDDKLLMEEASIFLREKITYGLGPENQIRAEGIQNRGKEGLSFKMKFGQYPLSIRLRVPGLQNVYNALAASAIAICLNEPYDHLVEGLYSFQGIKGRFNPVSLANGITLIDDTYNSNPTSLKAAIDAVKKWPLEGGQIIVGLGEMMELGDETIPAHREAGRMVANLHPRRLIAFGDHAHEMIEGAIGNGLSPERTALAKSHEEIYEKIEECMKEGDLIVLKGSRKMHLEKIVEMLTKQGNPEEKNYGRQ